MQILFEMMRFQIYYLIVFMIVKTIMLVTVRIKGFWYWITRKSAFIHEILHFFMAKILFIPVKWKDIHVYMNGNGSLSFHQGQKLVWFKVLLVSFAPLLGGTILLLELPNIWPENFNSGVLAMCCYYIIQFIILMSVSPSLKDCKLIWRAMVEEPLTFWRQLVFLCSSLIIFVYKMEFFIFFEEFIPYIFSLFTISLIFGAIELIWYVLKLIFFAIMRRKGYTRKYQEKSLTVSKTIAKESLKEVMGIEEKNSFIGIKRSLNSRKKNNKDSNLKDEKVNISSQSNYSLEDYLDFDLKCILEEKRNEIIEKNYNSKNILEGSL